MQDSDNSQIVQPGAKVTKYLKKQKLSMKSGTTFLLHNGELTEVQKMCCWLLQQLYIFTTILSLQR